MNAVCNIETNYIIFYESVKVFFNILHFSAYVAFYGFNSKSSGWPFNNYGSYGGIGAGSFNPFNWFGYDNGYYYNTYPPTNHVINFVVSNTVDAGATATATNNNQDNDDISNTATNAGGKRRKRNTLAYKNKMVDKGRTFIFGIIPLIGLAVLNTIVFLALSGYIILSEMKLGSSITHISKGTVFPIPIFSPNVTSTNMTSNAVDSMETVVTENINENNDVIKNLCNNNGVIITSTNSPTNICVTAGRALVKNFIPRKVLQDIIYILTYANQSSVLETGIESPNSI